MIESLGKNCPLFKSFIVSHELELSNGDFKSLVSENALKSLAQGCPLLHTFYAGHVAVPAAGVKYLVDYCPRLKDISLHTSDISDEVLAELGKSRVLTHVDISNCNKITDAGIEALVKDNGNHLEFLEILFCSQLTDAGLSSIGSHCPNLTSILVGDSGYDENHLTSVGLVRLAQQCDKLVDYGNSGSSEYVDMSLFMRIIDERKAAQQSK